MAIGSSARTRFMWRRTVEGAMHGLRPIRACPARPRSGNGWGRAASDRSAHDGACQVRRLSRSVWRIRTCSDNVRPAGRSHSRQTKLAASGSGSRAPTIALPLGSSGSPITEVASTRTRNRQTPPRNLLAHEDLPASSAKARIAGDPVGCRMSPLCADALTPAVARLSGSFATSLSVWVFALQLREACVAINRPSSRSGVATQCSDCRWVETGAPSDSNAQPPSAQGDAACPAAAVPNLGSVYRQRPPRSPFVPRAGLLDSDLADHLAGPFGLEFSTPQTRQPVATRLVPRNPSMMFFGQHPVSIMRRCWGIERLW